MSQVDRKKRSRKEAQQPQPFDPLWYFERMDQVNRAMQGTNDIEQMMKDVLDALLAVFDCDRAWLVYPCDPDAPTWQVPMERTRPEYPGVLPIGMELPLDPVGAEVYRILRNTDGPVKFGGGEPHAVPMEMATAFNIQSFIAMAFYPKIGKPWSFGLHQCSYERVWTPDEERLFQEIGRRLSDTLSTLLAYRNLQENETQIKQLIDASPVAMVISAGEEEQVLSINDKFIELFGYTMDDVPNVEHWWTLAYPDERYRDSIKTQWKEDVQTAIRGKGQIKAMEAQVTCKDGSIRFIEFQFASIGDKHLVTFVDLTARKLAENALKEREKLSQSLLRLSRKLEQSQTYADVLNAAQDEVRKMIGYQNLWAYLFEEDKKSAHVLFAQGPLRDKVMHSGETIVLQVRGDQMMEEIAEARQIVVVEDARTDPRTNKELVAYMGNRSIVNVPVILFDRHLGSVGMGTFGDEGLRIPTDGEQEYLVALASHMAVTLDRLHLLDKRKDMEQELIAREQEYRLLIENIPDLIVRYNTDLHRVYVNPAWEKTSGFSSSEVINKHPSDVSNPINEEYMGKLQQVLLTGSPQAIEFTWLNAFGKTLFLEYVIVPEYDQHGNISGVLSVGRDITERKQMEEALAAREREFRTLAENSPDNIARYNINCQTIYVNPALEKTLGHPASEILDTSPAQAGFIKESNEYQEKVAEVLRTGKEQEMDVVMPDIGEGLRYHNIRFVAERGADGTITGVLAIGREITERKRMEEALSASEAELRTLINTMTDIIFIGDSEGRFLKIIDTNSSLMYKPSQDLLGKTLHEVFPKDQADFFLKKIRQALTTQQPVDFEYALTIGIQPMWFYATVSPMMNDQTLMVARDITALKKAEENLRRSEQKFRTLAENIPNVVYQCLNNSRYTFLYLNEAVEDLTGYPREEFLIHGLSFFDLYHPDDLSIIPTPTENSINDVNREPFHLTYRIRHKSGEWRWVDEWGTGVTNQNGEVEYLEGIMVDITEQKRAEQTLRESEERYRQLVDLSPDAIGIHQQGVIVFANPSMVRIIGANNAEELFGTSILDFIHPDYHEVVQKRIQGDTYNHTFVEERIIRVDGTHIDIEVAAVPYEYQGQMHTQVIFRDITERKRHEREREAVVTVSAALRQATKRIEILSIILDQMSALFDAGGAFIALPHSSTGDIIIEMGRGPIGEKFNGVKIPRGEGISSWVIANKQPYLNNNAHTDPLFYRPDLLEDHHCVMSVPLIAREQSIGALWIARRASVAEQDLQLLNAIADIAANAIHRITLHEQTEQQLHHLIALHQIDLAITTNFDLSITLSIILAHVQTELAVNAASILLLNPDTESLGYAAGLGFITENIKLSNVKIGEGISGKAALEHCTASSPDLKLAGTKFSRASLLAEEGFESHFATPMLIQGQVKGVLEVFHRTPLDPDQEWFSYFETLATQAAIAIDNATLLQNLQHTNKELIQAYDATIEGWSRALDLRDRETEGHTQRVTEMSLQLADKIGMSEAEKSDLRRGALLHDIGKMGVPDAILHKPGELTSSEWEIMRQHPSFAHQMLSPITYLKRALDISYCHHEKWDGTGYPHGLKGEEIPLAARVFAVVDVFDALTSDRPYRKAWTPEEAYRYIEAQAGTHFDPSVVKVFLEDRTPK